jgi:hypothetical protein
MAPHFLSVTYGEAFHGLGVQGVKGLILVGALFLLDGGRRRKEKKKKKKKEKKLPLGRWVSLVLDPPCCLCSRLQLLGAIKGWFVGQSLNFFPAPGVMAVIILARSS